MITENYIQISWRTRSNAAITIGGFKNRFEVGDQMRWIGPDANFEFKLNAMTNRYDAAITVASGDGHAVRIRKSQGCCNLDLLTKRL